MYPALPVCYLPSNIVRPFNLGHREGDRYIQKRSFFILDFGIHSLEMFVVKKLSKNGSWNAVSELMRMGRLEVRQNSTPKVKLNDILRTIREKCGIHKISRYFLNYKKSENSDESGLWLSN